MMRGLFSCMVDVIFRFNFPVQVSISMLCSYSVIVFVGRDYILVYPSNIYSRQVKSLHLSEAA
jgi:hypothetical protein